MSKVQKLALVGLFVALDIIFTRFLHFYMPPGTYTVRISPQFLAHALAGWILGPWWALGSAVAGDLLGVIINTAGKAVYLGYTLSAALIGLIYGLFLHRRPVRWWRSLLAVSTVTLTISLVLTSVWNSRLYESPVSVFVISALPWRAMTIPVYSAVLFAVQKALERSKVITP